MDPYRDPGPVPADAALLRGSRPTDPLTSDLRFLLFLQAIEEVDGVGGDVSERVCETVDGGVEVGAGLEEGLCEAGLLGHGADGEGIPTDGLCGIGVCAPAEEQLDHVRVSGLSGHQEGSPAVDVAALDAGAEVEKGLGDTVR